MDRKGVLGLETTRVVLLSVLAIAVIALAAFMVLSNMRDTFEATENKQSGYVINETLTSVDGVGELLSPYRERNCVATLTQVTNATGAGAISSGNYTIADCRIRSTTQTIYNNTNWNVSFTYTYNTPGVYNITNLVTTSPVNFFKQVPTIFTLLGVVLLILVIAIVIVTVGKFGGGVGMGNKGAESDDYL